MASSPQWKSIIRFKDSNGQVLYGEPLGDDLKKATVFEGDDILSLTKSDKVVEVGEVLAPYVPDTILCIGLNYKEHATEGGFSLPKHPVVFHRQVEEKLVPSNAQSKNSITGPYATIHMPPESHAGSIDYENELCFVISRDAKNVSAEDAPDYILGYAVGNDVSSRTWQAPDMCGGQFSYAKNFDSFCPIGPAIVSSKTVGDPQNLKITTRRAEKVVQSSNTSDMIFGIYDILSFLSQGTTVPAGSLVMTGTPPGVAMFASSPPNFLKSGEVVECEIEKLGKLRNEFL
ncbi:hypothetical protein LTR97_007822 [Elasticomyces elasticus]|uniref:Fumarylacetoacetase-like C-terminal domain-containing protein n=1 Tax=Elasticomyces elasticus TaxID=574655 RepID=A0AAN7W295_9PEZI|nr:hypothetical protein LTR97_007822 [Elasticomyces elasticus]